MSDLEKVKCGTGGGKVQKVSDKMRGHESHDLYQSYCDSNRTGGITWWKSRSPIVTVLATFVSPERETSGHHHD